MIFAPGRLPLGRLSAVRACTVLRRGAHCIGCGSDLVPPVSRTRSPPRAASAASSAGSSAAAEQSKGAEALVSAMSDAQRAALNWAGGSDEIDWHELRHGAQARRAAHARASPLCKPCVMSREGTATAVLLPPPPPAVLGRRFHVVDALDFPAGVPFDELAAAAGRGDVFVVSRCDLVVARQSQLALFKHYAMRTVFGALGVPADRVHTVSAKHGWNLKKLAEAFVGAPKQNYFVGAPNGGKTTLVHALAGTSQAHGATAWPVPFTTQYATALRAQPRFRSKPLVDMPSTPAPGALALYGRLPPALLRKTGRGQQVVHRDPKYLVTPIRARSGQTVSIGGLVGLEFPRLPGPQLPIHVFPVIGGMNHTQFGQAFHSPAKLAEINASPLALHARMRMHTDPDLVLEPVAQFEPVRDGERQSLVIGGLGFLQPFLFGKFPEGYAATVHAPRGVQVLARPEFLPK